MPRTINLCFTMNIKPQSSSSQTPLPQNHSRQFTNSSPSDSEPEATLVPDFETAYASERFFFSSPGHSNSIIDFTSPDNYASSPRLEMGAHITCDSIAVTTYSLDPVVDFRRSMQEMVEARELHDVRQDWDCLRQLLMCYLSLNPKGTHKFIVKAFTDLVVDLVTSSPENKPYFSDCECEISRSIR